MIFGKYINRYYLKHAPVLLLGLAALLTVDYIQLLIPQLYRVVDDQPVVLGDQKLAVIHRQQGGKAQQQYGRMLEV
ncbi:MAG: hypothetical protein UGA93_15090, partial [Gemmiger formicilis]|uniref:hypothetical protein n=1 Tax=Gemmiger formicilis TaxID=745368 RepID=UPI002E761E44